MQRHPAAGTVWDDDPVSTATTRPDDLDHPRTENGLSDAQVAERVDRGLVNVTDRTSTRSVWQIVRTNVLTRFNAILGALFVLVLVAGSPIDGLFGLALIINSAIGITQEISAKRKLDQLALLNTPTTNVVRGGQVSTVPTGDVVLDDLIELRAGDQVPADGRVLTSAGLEIDESNLTGESDAVAKDVADECLSGTTVVAGTGRFHADAVGPDAYANRISAEARKFTRTRSEIQASINTLLRYITWVIVVALPLQIWSQWRAIGDQGWQQVIIRSSAGLVGLVPEGLVLLTSVAFLLAAVSLTKQQVLVQELPAVEGLARVDVVCLDKTGTLTVGDIVYEGLEHLDPEHDNGYVEAALGALADDPNANGTLVAVAARLAAPEGWHRTHTVAFNSARKWSAAEFDGHGCWVFGAPDVLLAADDPIRERVAELAGTGRRVLIAGQTRHPLTGPVLPPGLIWKALVVLGEQVRPDAAETLAFFAGQGVAIKVISGDNPDTVAAIASRVGLQVRQAVDARTLGEDPEELREIVEEATVFGRVSPQQKRMLVQALQKNGHVVAMTGDGVNDALALKDADIGVAMGNGAQATKAVAQLVLLDGKFSHLPSVLAEGRRVIGNVERVANLFVAKNVMSLIAIVSAAIFFLPFPFLPRHLTLVSTVTIGIPAFFLALGPNKRRYVPGFLDRVLRFAIPTGLLAGISVIVASLATHGTFPGRDGQQQTGTAATLALVVVFFWILVCLARPFVLWKVGLITLMLGVVGVAFLLPAGRKFFNFALPLEFAGWALLIGAVGAVGVEIVYRTFGKPQASVH